jgi:GntR family transcriptional regulator/MocR family aminotransferase
MRRHYKIKRDHLQQLLSQYLSPWFEWQIPSGGMHFLLIAKPAFNASEKLPSVCQAAKNLDQPIELFPLADYYQHPSTNTAGLIIGFTGINEKQLEWGIQQLAQLIAQS